MKEGPPNTREPQTSEQELRTHSPEQIPLSEQLRGLIEYADLSPEELRRELLNTIERIRHIEEVSRTEELTGLLNRRGFREEVRQIEAIFARERRDKKIDISTALLFLDLDGFKEVNETVGHACGDRGLQLIAEHVKGALRESDFFARVGGDEFSIFLPESDEKGALEVAGKVRTVIENAVSEQLRREFPSYKGTLSASIGIVASDGTGVIDGKSDMSIEEIMKRADYASYVVKAAGKRGELTLQGARETDASGEFERDFLAGKELPR